MMYDVVGVVGFIGKLIIISGKLLVRFSDWCGSFVVV